MAIAWDNESWFFTVRVEGPIFTDGYALVTGGIRSGELNINDQAVAILNSYKETWGTLTWTGCTIDSVQLYNDIQFAEHVDPEPGTGFSDAPYASNTALLLEKSTSTRGRRARGRSFIPGVLAEPDVGGAGDLSPGLIASAQSAANSWLTLGEPGDRPHAIPQSQTRPRKDGTPGTPPILPWPIVSQMNVDPIAATQRRRMRR